MTSHGLTPGEPRVCAQAHGEVLEIAAGTARNLSHYPAGVAVTGVELSPEMAELGRACAKALGREIDLRVGDAEKLEFADESFETVVCTYGLCTIPNDRKAIQVELVLARKPAHPERIGRVTSSGSEEHPYDLHVGRYGRELARGLIAFGGVDDGRVLDVGCGTGQLTKELVAVVGTANVAALDPAEGVVAVCRARVPGADVRVGSAEDLPFADDIFDAVLAQLVVNLTGDPPLAMAEMARVARPGAVVAGSFWDNEEMPLLRSYWDAVREVAPNALAGVNEQTQVGLADLGQLDEWWSDAGLVEVEHGEFEVGADYEDFDDLWFSFASGVGHSGSVYLALSPEQQAAVRASAHRRIGAPSGPFRLTAKVRAIRGFAPS